MPDARQPLLLLPLHCLCCTQGEPGAAAQQPAAEPMPVAGADGAAEAASQPGTPAGSSDAAGLSKAELESDDFRMFSFKVRQQAAAPTRAMHGAAMRGAGRLQQQQCTPPGVPQQPPTPRRPALLPPPG